MEKEKERKLLHSTIGYIKLPTLSLMTSFTSPFQPRSYTLHDKPYCPGVYWSRKLPTQIKEKKQAKKRKTDITSSHHLDIMYTYVLHGLHLSYNALSHFSLLPD